MLRLFNYLAILSVACAVVAPPAAAMGMAFRVAYSFRGAGDGSLPAAGLVMGPAGQLYGTTLAGGAAAYGGTPDGTVFRFDPARETLTVLHRFTPQEGSGPLGRLAFEPNGHVVGTLALGGALGCGSVYDLDPATLAYTTLFSFSCAAEGGKPLSGVVADAAGLLFGETSAGGSSGAGTIFGLNPAAHTLNVLHSFGGATGDGTGGAALLLSGGDLYGGSCVPGANPGFVFKLAPATGAMQTVHQFDGVTEGYCPGALVAGAGGMLFGTTQYSGSAQAPEGIAFKLNPSDGQLTILHQFGWAEGLPPRELTVGPAGDLYGTRRKGAYGIAGSTFRLNPVNGAYRELDNLRARKAFQAADPSPSVVADGTALYGTMVHGGVANQGTVFEIIE